MITAEQLEKHFDVQKELLRAGEFQFTGGKLGLWEWSFGQFKGKFSSMIARIDNFVRETTRSKNEISLLDVGAGNNNFAREMKARYPQMSCFSVVLTEERTPRESEADKELGLTYLIRPIEYLMLEWPEDKFDLAFSTRTLEHLADPLAVIEGLYRVMAVGGEMYLEWVGIKNDWESASGLSDGVNNFLRFCNRLKQQGIKIDLKEDQNGALGSIRMVIPRNKPPLQVERLVKRIHETYLEEDDEAEKIGESIYTRYQLI